MDFGFFTRMASMLRIRTGQFNSRKMVSNFLQMDVKVYRLSRIPLIIPFEGYKTMACV